MRILVATFNDAWHESSLGHVYRLNGDKWEVLELDSTDWVVSHLRPEIIEKAVVDGALREV